MRLPLRLARREVRRRPGRTALVALLVALPVAGMAMAVTLIRTNAETPLEEWTRTHGQADAAGFLRETDIDTATGAALLPSGSRHVEVASAWMRVKGASGTRAGVELNDVPLLDPITVGMYDLVKGRVATKPGEVVVSAAFADRFEVNVGDELILDRPDLSATVVGEVDPVGCLSCQHLILPPGELPVTDDGSEGTAYILVDLPAGLSLQELSQLQQASMGNLQMRDVPLFHPGDDGGEAVRWSLVIGALVLTVVGIVISAAFAVGARRQLVTLGQLSASGTSPATIRAALVLQGTVTGVVGSVAGLALAAGMLVLGQPLVERILDKRLDGYDLRALEVGAVVLIGVGAATLAALIPARTAARVPTLAALAGRRPLAPVSRRLISWGVASMLGGLSLLFIAVLGSRSGSSGDLWAFVAIIGGVAELLGACAIAPAFISRLEPLAHRLRGALRLGARSLARNRARTGAVVSAVGAAGALAVAAGGLILSSEASIREDASLPDDLVVVTQGAWDEVTNTERVLPIDRATERAVRNVLPGAQAVPLQGVAPFPSSDPSGQVGWEVRSNVDDDRASFGIDVGVPHWDRAVVADDGLLDAIRAGDDIRAALAETGVVALASHGGRHVAGPITVILPDGREVPGVSIVHEFSPGYTSGILLSEAVAAELGLEAEPLGLMFETSEPLTAQQRGDLEDLQFDLQSAPTGQESGYVGVQWTSPGSGPSPLQLELILGGVALVFSLFVVGVSLVLAAAESKDERDILTIAGAPPGLLARSAGARAWLLAVLGAGMAVPVGFLPVVVFTMAQRQDGFADDGYPLVFPTRTVLLLVVAVPLIVALVSWLSSATAQRFRPVRVSTAVFE